MKNIGLSCLFIGFALEMGALALNQGPLLRAGLALFLAGIPLMIIGRLLDHRRR